MSTRDIGVPRGQSIGYGRVSSYPRLGGSLALSPDRAGFGSARSGSNQVIGTIVYYSSFFIVETHDQVIHKSSSLLVPAVRWRRLFDDGPVAPLPSVMHDTAFG